jgi:2-aminoadipate transaminase
MRQTKSYHHSQPSIAEDILACVHLKRDDTTPLYRQISQGLREAILSGEIAEGSQLPTERALANKLGVNRTTVMNAYNNLASEGLIEGYVGRGTIVKRSQFSKTDDFLEPETPSWLLGLAASESELASVGDLAASSYRSPDNDTQMISLAPGSPAPDLLPVELLSSIVSAGLPQTYRQALGYCPAEGSPDLRRAIAAHMRTRGVKVDSQHILILSGSTQGLGLIGRFLLQPGDEVVVEIPTYLGAIQTFRALGARIIGVPTDQEGMRIDLLESILIRHQPRFIYTQPTFQNPSGAVLSAERRRRLLLLATRYQIPIIEDDPYGELYFSSHSPQPLKAMDTHNNVLYLSTYSKILAPGIQVAWLAAPEPVIERIITHKRIFDLGTNALGQWLVYEIYRRNLMHDHLTTIRQRYHARCTTMLRAIHDYWPSSIRVTQPAGGMHLWCRLPSYMRARTLARVAEQEGVIFVPGEPFHVDGGGHHAIRLSFASSELEHITEGVRRIGLAIHHLETRHQHLNEPDTEIERLPIV